MNNTPLEDQVHDALHRRVDPIRHAPFTVGDVRTRARRIQRRRALAAGAAVAAVLAVAVPVGLTMVGPNQRSDVPPATQPPAPSITGTVTIDPRSAPVGGPLSVPLINVDDPSLTVDGETTTLPRLYDQLTPYLDGWTGVAFTDDVGGRAVQVLDADFEVVDEFPMSSRLTVSPDGARLAWAWYDGDRWTVVDRDAAGTREERVTSMPPGPQAETLRAVGFLPGEGLVLGRTDASTGEETALVLDPDGATRPLAGFIKAGASSSAAGLVAGQTSFSGDGSCWRVSDAATGTAAWKTCDYSLHAFSPDGRYVVGLTDYLTPEGSPTLAFIDTTTWEPVMDFELAGPRTDVRGVNPEVLWEDSETLVAIAASGDRQFVVRLGVDGTVERVGGESVDTRPGEVPLKLAATSD